MRPALVVLAAGASRRLGTCKALAELGGRNALERLLAAGAALGDPAPLVVAGAHARDIESFLAAAELAPAPEAVRNEGWRAGRTGSVARAARARPGRDLCLAPVDAPLVARATFEVLARAWEDAGAPPRGWLAPRLRAAGAPPRHGHPVVVGRALLEDLSELAPDEPLRALRSRAEPLLAVEVADRAVLDDLDTPADLATLRERIRSR